MSEPLTLLARMRAKSGREARLQEELQRLVAPTRAEAGCITYDLHQSKIDSAEFLFYESWKDESDLDAHFETPHFQNFQRIVPELVEGQIEITKWTKLK